MKDSEIKIRVSKAFKDKILAEAESRGIKLSKLIREAIIKDLEKEALTDKKSSQLRLVFNEHLNSLIRDNRLRKILIEKLLDEIRRIK